MKGGHYPDSCWGSMWQRGQWWRGGCLDKRIFPSAQNPTQKKKKQGLGNRKGLEVRDANYQSLIIYMEGS